VGVEFNDWVWHIEELWYPLEGKVPLEERPDFRLPLYLCLLTLSSLSCALLMISGLRQSECLDMHDVVQKRRWHEIWFHVWSRVDQFLSLLIMIGFFNIVWDDDVRLFGIYWTKELVFFVRISILCGSALLRCLLMLRYFQTYLHGTYFHAIRKGTVVAANVQSVLRYSPIAMLEILAPTIFLLSLTFAVIHASNVVPFVCHVAKHWSDQEAINAGFAMLSIDGFVNQLLLFFCWWFHTWWYLLTNVISHFVASFFGKRRKVPNARSDLKVPFRCLF
jgi:hypothetical protein